jgi:hypothetical protein
MAPERIDNPVYKSPRYGEKRKGTAVKSVTDKAQMAYAPPRLRVLGAVHVLTQSIPAKVIGGADGAFYEQQSVSWAS